MWEKEIETIRAIIAKTELEETVKWGAPVFTINGKNVMAYAGFKNHFALWFYNGVFLKDEAKILVNAQKNKTKALRQWRFEKGDVFDEKLLLNYIKEAIENEKQGKVWKPQKIKLEIPQFLKLALDSDKKLNEAFHKLTPYKQKEYAEHIQTAKREATKQSRLEKIIPMILEGKGLHDKYKNC